MSNNNNTTNNNNTSIDTNTNNKGYVCIIKHAMNLIPVDGENLHQNIVFWIHVVVIIYVLSINSVLLRALCRVPNLFVAVRSLHMVLCIVDMILVVFVALNYIIPSLNAVRETKPKTCEIIKKTLITLSRTTIIVEPSFFLLIVIARFVFLMSNSSYILIFVDKNSIILS